ncbi:MAG: TRL domain-containing protein [bacterium]
MTKKSTLALAVAVALLLLPSGCTLFRAPVVPYYANTFGLNGWGFNDTTFPLDIAFDQTTIGTRKGSTKAYSAAFGLLAWGNCSIQEAARNGNIATIDHVDMRYFNILLFYTEFETIVYGRAAEDLAGGR